MSRAEKLILDYTMNCSNEMAFENKDGSKLYYPWLSPDDARSAVEIAREEIYEWLRINLCDYFDAPRKDYDMCLDDLKNSLKK